MRALFIADDFVIEPLGIMWLSSYLKAAGHEVDIVKWKGIGKVDAVAEFHPDMVCYSVTTGKHTYYQQLNLNLKQLLGDYFLSVFGGPHCTFFPEFAREEGVNVAVQGEGFDAIVDIANLLDKGGIIPELANFPNIVVNGYGNGVRPLKDKANLLHPDRELIYKYPENYHNRIKNVMASFGCPMSCPYCFNDEYRKLYGSDTLQIRPVDDVIIEIEELQSYPLDLIFFQDDVFPLYKPDWLFEFCDKYKRIEMPFHIQVRIEYLAEEALKRLKDVGLHGVTFAIESGNQQLRRNVLKRYMSDDTIIRGAELLHKYDIKFRTENMVGIPSETWDTAMETLDLNIRCDPTIAWASVYQPYPGTQLGNQCIEDRTFDGDIDSISGSFFDTYRLKVPHGKRYERLQKLFSVIVAHPRLRRFATLLVSLPLDKLYRRVYKWYKRRMYDKKLYKV